MVTLLSHYLFCLLVLIGIAGSVAPPQSTECEHTEEFSSLLQMDRRFGHGFAEPLGTPSAQTSASGPLVRPELSPVPSPGVHPRVFFSSEDLPAIRARLLSSVGSEAMTQIRLFTNVMRSGRSYFDRLPNEQKLFADGQKRIPNVGLYDNADAYQLLVRGDAGGMDLIPNDPHLGTLAGGMALEAFECLVDEDRIGAINATARLQNLATALDAWASWEHTLSADRLGYKYEVHFALAYDMAYNTMTDSQRVNVRRALAQVLSGGYYNAKDGGYFGALLEPQAATSNWIPLNTFFLIVACAVEGELVNEDYGLTNDVLDAWFRGGMKAQEAFLSHGLWPSGAPYEGQGKGQVAAGHQIAFARRGYNFFGHPHLQAHANMWFPAIVQPYGYAFLSHDKLGGTGTDPVRGGWMPKAIDIIGLKFMYPHDRGIDFAFHNFVYKQVANSSSETFVHIGDTLFAHRGLHGNQLLMAAIFASDASHDGSATSRQAALNFSLDYLDAQGATLIARSGYESDATVLQMHIRQDFGGHTYADRGAFTLASLGRLFFAIPTVSSRASNQGSEFNGETLVDGLASKVTHKDGEKMRIPAKLAAWSALNSFAMFATCDSTYSYSNEWYWGHLTGDGEVNLKSGFEVEEATFNLFRRRDNKLTAEYGDTPLFEFPSWQTPNKPEGIQKRAFNPMRQVYRTAGLVRGVSPYALVIEDIRKDDSPHNYTWHIPIAADLEVLSGSHLPVGTILSTDVVLKEPDATGNRRLLVRIISAAGQLPEETPFKHTSATPPAYRDTILDDDGNHHARLVIRRDFVVAPDFLMLFFPFRMGDQLPITTMSNNMLEVNIGGQSDLYNFSTRSAVVAGEPVMMREFVLRRAGETLVDYRDLIEPIEAPRTEAPPSPTPPPSPPPLPPPPSPMACFVDGTEHVGATCDSLAGKNGHVYYAMWLDTPSASEYTLSFEARVASVSSGSWLVDISGKRLVSHSDLEATGCGAGTDWHSWRFIQKDMRMKVFCDAGLVEDRRSSNKVIRADCPIVIGGHASVCKTVYDIGDLEVRNLVLISPPASPVPVTTCFGDAVEPAGATCGSRSGKNGHAYYAMWLDVPSASEYTLSFEARIASVSSGSWLVDITGKRLVSRNDLHATGCGAGTDWHTWRFEQKDMAMIIYCDDNLITHERSSNKVIRSDCPIIIGGHASVCKTVYDIGDLQVKNIVLVF